MAYEAVKSKDKMADLLQTFRDNFQFYANAEARQRKMALEDLRFYAVDQWDPLIRSAREQAFKPCLTEDRTSQVIKQIVNDARQNRPMVRITPVDGGADLDTAEIIQGIIRHIEYASNASIAYDTGFEAAAIHGRGYWRVSVGYTSADTFEQEIRIDRIRNPFTVYMDPACQSPDYSDAQCVFVTQMMSEKDYKARFPDAKGAKESWSSIGDLLPGWCESSYVRVAEVFYKVMEDVDVALLDDGSTVDLDKVPEGAEIKKQRKARRPRWKWCVTNGFEILEGLDNPKVNDPVEALRDWPSIYHPIIPNLGEETDVNGEVYLCGMVKRARDPQRMHNVWVSAESEAISLVPKAPYLMPEGGDEGYEEEWANLNTENRSVLHYKTTDAAGNPMTPPQRIFGEPAISAITKAKLGTIDAIKAVNGVFDASLGAQGNETSGKAILARQRQSQVGNFHLIDNHARSLTQTGRVILSLIPVVYDTNRIIRILGEDGEAQTVEINSPLPVAGPKGVEKVFDTTIGNYDVVIDAGPSYATKRIEARESMMALANAFPPLIQAAGDLMVKNMDWPGAKDVAERLKKMLPPELQDQGPGGAMPPEAQQAIGQMQQEMEQMQQMLQQAQMELQTKQGEHEAKMAVEQGKTEAAKELKQMEMEGQLSVEHAKLEVEMTIKSAELESKMALEQAKIESAEKIAFAQLEVDMLKIHGTLAEGEDQRKHELKQVKLTAAKSLKELENASDDGVQETEEQINPLKGIVESLKGLHQMQISIKDAVVKAGGAKRVIYDKQGRAIGVEPA